MHRCLFLSFFLFLVLGCDCQPSKSVKHFGQQTYRPPLKAQLLTLGFGNSKVVPDIVDDVPNNLATVIFNNTLAVLLGNELKPANITQEPFVSWPAENQLYTLVMLDPDAPSTTVSTERNFLHWLVYNIRGTDIKSGKVHTAWLGSLPEADTGAHRYTFLVFLQPRPMTITPPKDPKDIFARAKFDLRAFVKSNGLQPVPTAGNFYTAQADAYTAAFWQNFAG